MDITSHTVRPDAKGRITLGKLAQGVSSYRIEQAPDGKLILEPYMEIPKVHPREQWLYDNPEALASVLRGIEQSKNGQVHYLGDFSQYLNEELD